VSEANDRPRVRAVIAIAIGTACGLASWAASRVPGVTEQDFKAWWLAARLVLQHQNPYTNIVGIGGQPAFFHPLPTAIATIPFTFLPEAVAGSIFTGLACGLLAFAVTETAWWPLLIFLSSGLAWSVVVAQLSPLLVAATLLPSLTWVGFLKPNIGIAMFAHRPSIKAAVIILLITVASLAVRPTWPAEWIATTRRSPFHFAPWRATGGVVLLLAFLRWRRPEARLLAVLALVPQSPIPYEALILFVIPRSRGEMIGLVLLGDIAGLLISNVSFQGDPQAFARIAVPAMLWLMYVPALVMVLARPNVGPAPAWVEQCISGLPQCLRGANESVPIGIA